MKTCRFKLGFIGLLFSIGLIATPTYAAKAFVSSYAVYPAPIYSGHLYAPPYISSPAPSSDMLYLSGMPYYNHSALGYCREITEEILVHGELRESYATACLQPDGNWRVVD